MRVLTKMLCVAATLVASGCGGDGLRMLGPEDVGPIAPGTAVGALFSGDYVVTSGAVDACHCRAGSCATILVTINDIMTANQADGALELFFASTQDAVSGGIHADGTFRCSGANQSATGIGYALITGQFQSDGVVPTGVSLIDEVTLRVASADCDIRAHRTAEFLRAAASQDGGARLASGGRGAGFLGVGLQ